MPTKGVFPTRENCDPDDPEEAFLWMLAAPPGVVGGQFIFPIEYGRELSKHLWALGARPTAPPTLEYSAPFASDPHWLTSPGRWVPAGSETQQDRDLAAVQRGLSVMGYQQKTDLKQALEAAAAGEPPADSAAGKVVASLNDEQRQLIYGTMTDS